MPDLVTSKIFVDGEKGITATKMNQIISGAVIQSDFYTAKSTSSTLDSTDQLLELKSTGSYARITGQQLIDSVSASVTQNITPTITAVRLRSINVLGNSTFEVDQRSVGNTVANPVSGTLVQDRWSYQKAGTMVASNGQVVAAANEVLVPGTNFAISRNFNRTTITTAQTTLGTTDYLVLSTAIEGPRFRELQYDVHSVSLLVRSSVAGLKFGLSIRDPGLTKSLLKLCTIPSANTWTLITLPNLPVFPSAGNFSSAPGVAGYLFAICLAAGTTVTASANDTFQNANVVGALGQSNLAATAGATFDCAYVMHEPGAQSTTPIDCPFTENLDACLRYYQKTYDYGTAAGTVTVNGARGIPLGLSTTVATCPVNFHKPMAKVPTVTIYNAATGAANSVQDSGSVNHSGAAAGQIGQSGLGYISFTTATGPGWIIAHYIADTGS